MKRVKQQISLVKMFKKSTNEVGMKKSCTLEDENMRLMKKEETQSSDNNLPITNSLDSHTDASDTEQ